MIPNNFRIGIQKDFAWDGLTFYICQERGADLYVCKPMEMQFEKRSPGERVEPSLSMGLDLGQEFCRAIQEELAKKGVKSDNELTMQGELKAVQKHLQDMRKLVFK